MKKPLSKQTLKTLEKTGYFKLKAAHGKKSKKLVVQNVQTPSNLAPLSNAIEANGLKRDPMAHKWKAGLTEKPETVREIERKSKCSAPLFNKGGYMYISPETSTKDIGRK